MEPRCTSLPSSDDHPEGASLPGPRPPIVVVVVQALLQRPWPRVLLELPLRLRQLLLIDRTDDVVLRRRRRPPPREEQPPDHRDQKSCADPESHRLLPHPPRPFPRGDSRHHRGAIYGSRSDRDELWPPTTFQPCGRCSQNIVKAPSYTDLFPSTASKDIRYPVW